MKLAVLLIVAALCVGFGVVIDRATWIMRLTQWPLRDMPATNGAVLVVLLLGVGILVSGTFQWLF